MLKLNGKQEKETREFAKSHDLDAAEALEWVVQTGIGRIAALDKFARKAAKAEKPKAKKQGAAKKPKPKKAARKPKTPKLSVVKPAEPDPSVAV